MEKSERLQKAWLKRREMKEHTRMIEKLKELLIEDFEMETELIEVRVLEMMVQDDMEELAEGLLEDKDQIMQFTLPKSDMEGMVVVVYDAEERMETSTVAHTPILSPKIIMQVDMKAHTHLHHVQIVHVYAWQSSLSRETLGLELSGHIY
jgi:hypothetical protein